MTCARVKVGFVSVLYVSERSIPFTPMDSSLSASLTMSRMLE